MRYDDDGRHGCLTKHSCIHASGHQFIHTASQLLITSQTSKSIRSPTVHVPAQSHSHQSSHVPIVACMMLSIHPQFQSLHPQYVLRICPRILSDATSLSAPMAARDVPFFTLLRATSALGMKKPLCPLDAYPGSFLSRPAGRRILYCQIYVMFISRVPKIFGGKKHV
jgi:hypothetical protein